MGLGERIEQAIHARRRRLAEAQPGALGAFHRAGGNGVLLRGAPLGEGDLVIDAGGFRGDFTAEICWRFGARSLVLEPVPAFAAGLRDRFGKNGRVRVIEAALGASEGTLDLGLHGDGTSSFRSGGPTVKARLLDAAALLEAEGPVGLLKVNIEGGEYDALDRLIERGLLGRVRSLLVQFHPVAPDSAARRDRIRAALARTHREAFDFPFVWERWDALPSAQR